MADDMSVMLAEGLGKDALWAEVKRRRATGAFVSALPILERLVTEYAGEHRFHACYGEALMEAGRDEDAKAPLRRAIELSPEDAKSASKLASLEARSGAQTKGPMTQQATALKQTLQELMNAGEHAKAISAYHAALRAAPEVVNDIEEWAPIINRAGAAIYDADGNVLEPFVRQIIDDVRQHGIAIRSFESVFGETRLLEQLVDVVSSTEDWYVPGKGHFIKALREAPTVTSGDHPVMRSGLHPGPLSAANGFYGLYSRLVSCNIVRTVAKDTQGRVRQSSEGWHRDPEDFPMFKSFIYLNDVTELDHGPFQYIPDSRRGGRYEYLLTRFGRGVYDRTFKTRPDWAQVDHDVQEADIVTVTGRAGTMFFCDTSGFHRGGYCVTQDRYMVANVYQRPGSQFPSYVLTDTDLPSATIPVRMALGQAN